MKNLVEDLTSAAVCIAFAFVMIMLCGVLS
jgi:hypothetical protein